MADFKRSWSTAKRLASIGGLTFHDLRRTAITRIVQCGVPIEIARKIAGHAPTDVTSKHYVAANAETIGQVTDFIDERNEGSLLRTASKGAPYAPDIQTAPQMVN